MNWKTTLVLGFFVGVLAMYWLDRKPTVEQSIDKTDLAPLENIRATHLRKIEANSTRNATLESFFRDRLSFYAMELQ